MGRIEEENGGIDRGRRYEGRDEKKKKRKKSEEEGIG
jgi:hypothetical protein